MMHTIKPYKLIFLAIGLIIGFMWFGNKIHAATNARFHARIVGFEKFRGQQVNADEKNLPEQIKNAAENIPTYKERKFVVRSRNQHHYSAHGTAIISGPPYEHRIHSFYTTFSRTLAKRPSYYGFLFRYTLF